MSFHFFPIKQSFLLQICRILGIFQKSANIDFINYLLVMLIALLGYSFRGVIGEFVSRWRNSLYRARWGYVPLNEADLLDAEEEVLFESPALGKELYNHVLNEL